VHREGALVCPGGVRFEAGSNFGNVRHHGDLPFFGQHREPPQRLERGVWALPIIPHRSANACLSGAVCTGPNYFDCGKFYAELIG
jgi:hypothetical protein